MKAYFIKWLFPVMFKELVRFLSKQAKKTETPIDDRAVGFIKSMEGEALKEIVNRV